MTATGSKFDSCKSDKMILLHTHERQSVYSCICHTGLTSLLYAFNVHNNSCTFMVVSHRCMLLPWHNANEHSGSIGLEWQQHTRQFAITLTGQCIHTNIELGFELMLIEFSASISFGTYKI